MLFQLFKRAPLPTRATIALGATTILIVALLAIFAGFIAPYDPYGISDNTLVPPSPMHLMGTDKLGRDILSRVIHGGRMSILVAFLSVLMSATIGSILGVFTGYYGGKLDVVETAIMDSLYTFPALLMALIVSAVLGPGVLNISFAVGIPWVPLYYRTIRSIALSIKGKFIITVEKSLGASSIYIIINHVVPNCIPSTLVLTSLGMSRAVLTVAGLGFLGFGIGPPTSEWGTDLSLGRAVLLAGYWWPMFFPGVMIVILCLAFNLLGEGLNVMLNPRYRVR